MATIKLTEAEWTKLHDRISKEHPPAVLLIRTVMKRELGFTTRTHHEWTSRHGYSKIVCLDFFDDQQETMFRLKYL